MTGSAQGMQGQPVICSCAHELVAPLDRLSSGCDLPGRAH